MSNVCFHCGLPADNEYDQTISGKKASFCCMGCQAVAMMISQGGLERFYQFRDIKNNKANEELADYTQYDLPELTASIATVIDEKTLRVKFYLSDISCAACVWLIEQFLHTKDGIVKISINGTTKTALISFHKDLISLGEIMQALAQIGYPPEVATHNKAQEQFVKNQKKHLLQMAVAGLAMMQIGMVSTALYAGGIQGIDAQFQWLLRWVNLIFAVPVMLYSAQPFFKNAYRALRLRGLNMDVPVSLALILAFAASVYATVLNTGEVYFDSVAMFTFFLLLGRFLEQRIRFKNQHESLRLVQLLPVTVTRIENNTPVLIPLQNLKVNDEIEVKPGEVFACDGIITSGTTTADESLLTGESKPQAKEQGSVVIAGSINGDTQVRVKANAVGGQTQLASVEKLIDDAEHAKPQQVLMADKLSKYFVFAVIVVSVIVGTAWWFIDASKTLWVVLSVLVITCPCALSLATPAALTSATSRLRKLGFLIRSNHVLEALNQIEHVVFDKTGTLTQGNFNVTQVCVNSTYTVGTKTNKDNVLSIVSALEKHSRHPIAQAFKRIHTTQKAYNVEVEAGLGIQGVIDKTQYLFGKAEFIQAKWPNHAALKPPTHLSNNNDTSEIWQCLANNDGVIAWIAFSDSLRDDAKDTINALKLSGKELHIVSGDKRSHVQFYADKLQVSALLTDCLPGQKLDYIKALQAQNQSVMMVGDGINDAPVLSAANVSVAMHDASSLAKIKADAVLLHNNLAALEQTFIVAKDVKRIIKQNLCWALGYNIVALPLAACGLIPPYLAAAGMSLSSLIVVVNSLRLNKARP